MNTIIIFSELRDSIKQLHFNLWDSKENNLHFLDIGILCSNSDFKISIKVPCEDSLEIQDLIPKFEKEIPNAIFNESVTVEEKDKIKILSFRGMKYILSPLKASSCLSEQGITAINIENKRTEIPEVVQNKDKTETECKYYRFRIKNFDISKVRIGIDSKSKSFESSFSACKIIDFRLNDLKLLSISNAQELNANFSQTEKIHFLYMVDANESIESANNNFIARFMERRIWDDYLDLKKRKIDMIAYHLKEENTFSANFLLKCNYNKTSKKHLAIYILIVIGIAIIANIASSWLVSFLKI